MPTAAKRICSHPGCNELTTGNKCESHQAQARSRNNWKHKKNSTQRGYGSRWQKIRKLILQRDNHLCQQCKKVGLTTPANEVDHIVSKARGGTDNPSNLQAICSDCHRTKTATERRGEGG